MTSPSFRLRWFVIELVGAMLSGGTSQCERRHRSSARQGSRHGDTVSPLCAHRTVKAATTAERLLTLPPPR